MTAPAVERITHIVMGDFTWEYANVDLPGNCDRFGWCDGDCKPLLPGQLGDMHSRYIASALRDADLVEIGVGQWKANPKVGIRDTGSCFALNRDRDPRVGIFTSPDDLAMGKRVFLSVADAEGVASALRLVGADPFAGALEAAVTFAHKLSEEKR